MLLSFAGALLCLLPLSNAQIVTTIGSQVDIDDALILSLDGQHIIGSEYDGDAVRVLSLDGQVEVLVPDLNTPNGLAFDSQGNLFIADNVGDKIYKVLPDGTYSEFLSMNGPSGMIKEWDSDTLIVTTYTGTTLDKVFKLAPDGEMIDFIVNSDMNGPVGLCYDDDNNLYVGNFNDRRVFSVAENGEITLVGQYNTSGNLGFIDYRDGYIYGTLFQRSQIWRMDLDGNNESWLGSTTGSVDGGIDEAKFNRPNGIVFSPTKDTLFISDFGSESVRMITDIDGMINTTMEGERSIVLKTFPNPATTQTTISLALPHSTDISLQLKDQMGRHIKDITTLQSLSAGEYRFTCDLKEVPSGLYYIQVKSSNNKTLISIPIVIN